MAFIRKQYDVLIERIGEPRRFIQVIAGPRQVGKSTLVKQVMNNVNIPHIYHTTEDAADRSADWLRVIWEQARQHLRINKEDSFLLVIDEIHKIDNWSEVVKGEWDKDTMNDVNMKVILLGSSRMLLKDGLEESLAGRYEMIEMSHWSLQEMQDAFSLTTEQYIYFGGYPGGVSLLHDEKRWRKYIKTAIIEPAITKDVLLTKRIYKPALLRQLFELGCSYSGQLLSFNKILGQLQDAGNTDTLATYLRVLDESCLICGLQKYASQNIRKYNSIPKYQVYNSALLTAETDCSFADIFTDPKRWGRWVETAVGTHLVNQAKEGDYNVFYWREKNDEVDFIIQRSDQLVAIEVKSGAEKLNNGVFVFKNQFNPKATLIVGDSTMSVEQFLKTDIEVLFK